MRAWIGWDMGGLGIAVAGSRTLVVIGAVHMMEADVMDIAKIDADLVGRIQAFWEVAVVRGRLDGRSLGLCHCIDRMAVGLSMDSGLVVAGCLAESSFVDRIGPAGAEGLGHSRLERGHLVGRIDLAEEDTAAHSCLGGVLVGRRHFEGEEYPAADHIPTVVMDSADFHTAAHLTCSGHQVAHIVKEENR